MLGHGLRATTQRFGGKLTYIGLTTAGKTGTDTCVLSVPSGTQIGDLLVAITVLPDIATQTPASGWSEKVDSNSRTVSTFTWDGANSSYTFTSSVGSAVNSYPGVMLSFRNAAFDVAGTVSTTADNPTAPSITVSTNNCIQVVCAGVIAGNTTFTQTSGFTEIADLNTQSPALGSLAVQYKTNVASGSTGTVTYFSDGAATLNNRAWQFSIKPG